MKVLDASGIINLRDRELEGEFITVPEVKGELRDVQARLKFEAAVVQGKIHLEEPSLEAFDRVEAKADKHGVLPLLSIADIKVLALAYERKLPIVTDDYDIQNMCWIMGLGFETVAVPGIKEAFEWSKKCYACGKEYTTDISECEACGSKRFIVSKRYSGKR